MQSAVKRQSFALLMQQFAIQHMLQRSILSSCTLDWCSLCLAHCTEQSDWRLLVGRMEQNTTTMSLLWAVASSDCGKLFPERGLWKKERCWLLTSSKGRATSRKNQGNQLKIEQRITRISLLQDNSMQFEWEGRVFFGYTLLFICQLHILMTMQASIFLDSLNYFIWIEEIILLFQLFWSQLVWRLRQSRAKLRLSNIAATRRKNDSRSKWRHIKHNYT